VQYEKPLFILLMINAGLPWTSPEQVLLFPWDTVGTPVDLMDKQWTRSNVGEYACLSWTFRVKL